MATYKLNKTVKGNKFEYTVTDESGNVVSTRTSKNQYVACTANGDFYFGRLDLIGKGDHGKLLNRANLVLSNPVKAWEAEAKQMSLNPKRWKVENPFNEWLEWVKPISERRSSELNKIAYL